MKKVVGGIVGIVILLFGALFAGNLVLDVGDSDEDFLRVASFNGEIFGDTKISNVGVDYYVDLIEDYDLFFLLEIRDSDGSSFWEVCDGLDGYECYLSNRSGRTRSKESVGVFVKEELGVSKLNSYVDDSSLFERAPVWIDVEGVRYWAVHLAPENVYREMEALEALVLGVGDLGFGTVVLGDMNADCDYYSSGVDFDSWNWVIGDEADTSSGFKDCAYDRIIVSESVEVLGSGVIGIDSLVSDHNSVWAEVGK